MTNEKQLHLFLTTSPLQEWKQWIRWEKREMMEEFQMEETNNYEKWCEQWREKFLQMDQEELKKRLPELKEEGNWLTISLWSWASSSVGRSVSVFMRCQWAW